MEHSQFIVLKCQHSLPNFQHSCFRYYSFQVSSNLSSRYPYGNMNLCKLAMYLQKYIFSKINASEIKSLKSNLYLMIYSSIYLSIAINQLILYLSISIIQIKRVSDGERNAPEMQALKDSLDKIKNGLSESNTKVKIIEELIDLNLNRYLE